MGFFAYIKRKINEALDAEAEDQIDAYERELQASREPDTPTSVIDQIRSTGSRAQFERKDVDSDEAD